MKMTAKKHNLLLKLCIILTFAFLVLATAFSATAYKTRVKAETEPTIVMGEGASMRLTQDSGLRFWGYVSNTHFDDVAGKTLKAGVVVGMDVSITVSGAAKTQTVSTADAGWIWAENDKDGWQKYQVAILYSGVDADAYATQVTATAFVSVNGQRENAENPQTRSVAQVANAALTDGYITNEYNPEDADNAKPNAQKILENFVTANNALVWETPNLTLTGDTLNWTAVDGAKGYIVKVNETTIPTTQTSLDLTAFAKDGVVSVTAYGDGTSYTYCVAEDTVNYYYLTNNQLATFNSELYKTQVQRGNPNVGDLWGNKAPFKQEYTNTFNSNGTVSCQTARVAYLKGTYGDYRECQIWVWTVTLSKPLDFTRDGITVKFAMSRLDGTGDNYITMLNPTSKCAGYTTSPLERGNITANDVTASCPYIKVTTDANYEFNVSSVQLKALGYKEGATLLTFACWNTVKETTNNANTAKQATIVFDDISYYEMLDTPVVTVSGNTANWTAVDGAQNYTVFANGVEKATVTTTTFDLTALTETANVQVCANADGAVSSLLSNSIYYEVLTNDQLATFNTESYKTQVQRGNPNVGDLWTNKAPFKQEYTNTFNSNGTVTSTTLRTTYSSTPSDQNSCHIWVWSVTLSKPLDLTRDGITVKFKMTKLVNAGEDNYITMLNPTSKVGYNKSPTERGNITANGETASCPYIKVTTGVNYEFSVSSTQLKALGYTEGGMLLTFACWNTTGRATTGVGTASSATIVFDDISYCEMLDTPEVTVSGNTANWTAVEGAQSYTVFVNGVEIETVTTTTFDLTALTETAKIQVRANANAEGVTSSSLSLQCEYVVTSV